MSKTILVVEDNDFIRRMYVLKFSKAGLDVVEAIDGAEAIKSIEESIPDLVLLDLMMPNVGGIEVLQTLHKKKITPKLPVIVLTNIMNAETIEQARKLGAIDYIIKTDMTPSQVLEKLKSYIS